MRMYTEEEVLELMLQERKRAMEIARGFKDQNTEKATSFGKYTKRMFERQADECRLIGNAISGLNGLSIVLDVTIEDLIKKELEKWQTKKQ